MHFAWRDAGPCWSQSQQHTPANNELLSQTTWSSTTSSTVIQRKIHERRSVRNDRQMKTTRCSRLFQTHRRTTLKTPHPYQMCGREEGACGRAGRRRTRCASPTTARRWKQPWKASFDVWICHHRRELRRHRSSAVSQPSQNRQAYRRRRQCHRCHHRQTLRRMTSSCCHQTRRTTCLCRRSHACQKSQRQVLMDAEHPRQSASQRAT